MQVENLQQLMEKGAMVMTITPAKTFPEDLAPQSKSNTSPSASAPTYWKCLSNAPCLHKSLMKWIWTE
jgi:hypothetical protein